MRGVEGPVFFSFRGEKIGDFLPLLDTARAYKNWDQRGGGENLIVNQKELAQCLDISTRQVRNLKSEGLFQTVENGRGYRLEKCVREYIDFKINAETDRRTHITKEEVQAQHEEVKKQISLLKLRKLRRELHEAAHVEAFLTDMLMSFRNRLLSLPPKLAMQLSGEGDINVMIGIIKKELENTLEELAEYDPDEIDGTSQRECDEDEPGEDIDEDDEEDGDLEG